ncbi:MAG: outer membrane lipoprotein-sorting protein, partial [Candidatus Marinimicrobia bacterium]|jgi:outer membrane lipoprotein-sorting protein|nr:outer membrane lipoprotein-sorting protein [Candidatus Neomarinimicrobiota bacterium]
MKKILILLFGFTISLQAGKLTGRDVIVNMESSKKVLTTKMNIKLTHTEIKRDKEKVRIREMIRYHKRYIDSNYKSKSLLRFIKPDIVKGTGFLIWSNRSGGNDQWLFLPKLKTAKRIESKAKTQRFMNTEFSYEDLESFNQSDEQYFLKDEENLNDQHCYIVEVLGHTQTQYKRRLVWIDSEDWLLRRVEFYDKSNKLLKVLTISEYQSFENFNFSTKLIMRNIQTGSQTVMDVSDIKYNIDLPDSYFTKDSLVKP